MSEKVLLVDDEEHFLEKPLLNIQIDEPEKPENPGLF